jgi:hypothetical protein
MPWCEGCSRFLNPNTLRSDGTCPTCEGLVADPKQQAAARTKAPWHFKLLVAATVIYLGFRLVQMLGWIVT